MCAKRNELVEREPWNDYGTQWGRADRILFLVMNRG